MRALSCIGGLVVASLACFPSSFAAASEGAPPMQDAEEGSTHDAMSISFAGGMMIPREALAETRSAGLLAGMTFGLSAMSGLGVALSAEYAPLPPASASLGSGSRESHVGALTLAPRFTLGRRAIRPWLEAGAGLLVDYESIEHTDAEAERRVSYEPMAAGAIGFDLHAFDSGGLALAGRYARSFADPHHELITATGGLFFQF